MAVASRYRRDEGMGRTVSAPDPDEEAALDRATEALRGARGDMREAARACITAWIQERSRRQAGVRLPDNVVFDLGDAKLRGVVEAALPNIGKALSHIPSDTPLFSLPKDNAIDVFATSFAAIVDVNVRAGEASDFPFSDGIPF